MKRMKEKFAMKINAEFSFYFRVFLYEFVQYSFSFRYMYHICLRYMFGVCSGIVYIPFIYVLDIMEKKLKILSVRILKLLSKHGE